MTDSLSDSLEFQVTTISISSNVSEVKSENEGIEEVSSFPEVYSKFIEAKQITHPNLSEYFSFEQVNSNKALVISESHSYNLEKLLETRM